MIENQSTYRIRTQLGESEPINIPVSLMQEYNSFEILSLKINTDESYRSYTSTEGIVVGRVSTQNNGLGIPNVRVSIFVPKGTYQQSDEEAVLYPFSSPTDLDGDRVRYNLLPSDSDVECYQVIGTLPTKRKILDNETVCEVFDKYYKYTTVTNRAGDFLLSNIPVGKHRIHIDADLSDIGPFLSQKPYNMIENLGFDKNKFESTRQFKTSTDLDSLAQVISQNKSVYVYPYWGDTTENSAELKITRTDLSLNYEFKTMAVFIGSVITDKQSNSIMQNCTSTENNGKMADLVTGPGRIEMIRKTLDNKVEQYKIKGDALINDNGVWCYSIPMNLDYVRTDEYGNIIPTDDPNKGVPTRARVRFRITLNQMDSDKDAHKRCSYLVPNNPQYDDEKFLKENDADYSFGSDTWDESFIDLFWNKVYTVKNYIPRIQKTVRPTNRKHTGIKMVNHFGDNNPFPYNGMTIKLPFQFRLICIIVKLFIILLTFLNIIISTIGALPCWLASLKLPLIGRPFGFVRKYIPSCIELSSEFCDDGINKNVYYPGCKDCVWSDVTLPKCDKEQLALSQKGEEHALCTTKTGELYTCVEDQLAQQNEATSFNFSNDWINGCLYMPLWYRHIRPKKSFLFGLIHRRAKDQWCAGENNISGRSLNLTTFCSNGHSNTINGKDYKGNTITFHYAGNKNSCGDSCHEKKNYISLNNGIIINRDNSYGKKVWYYKSVEAYPTANGDNGATEYLNANGSGMVAKLLFATDIVLLGSLNDCDMNGIPKFFNYLKASTYNMPTDILFTDTEITYEFDENGNLKSQTGHKTSIASGCDKGNKNEYGYSDGGLFYDIGCSTIEVYTPSCINLRRICELGVGIDEIKYIENLTVAINNDTDTLDYNNDEYNLRPDGFISYDDIIDFDYRSMFATMNSNRLKTKINRDNGVREYDFRHLYIDNFDGSLKEMMESTQKGEPKANYRYNFKLEEPSTDYMTFRMGERPYYYDGESLKVDDNNLFVGAQEFTLPKYRNSFYFYFGIKEGKSAIDLFNQQYNEKCATKSDEEESINYEKQANGWCFSDSDENGKYDHANFDGYLKIDLGNISLPCSAVLNSRSNSTITYTILNGVQGDGKMTYNTSITDDKICFYGKLDDDDTKNKEEITRNFTNDGYKKYYLLYENTSNSAISEGGIEGCEMLNNDEYDLIITDSEGNYHSFIINIKVEYLTFEDVERNFGQSNKLLLKYYNSYEEIAKDEKSIEIKNDADSIGVPYVFRYGTNIDKLNGTICIYDIALNEDILNNTLIEVEPYDKSTDDDGVEYYTDKDFWKDGDKTQSWYKPKMFNNDNAVNMDGEITEENNKEYVYGVTKSKYFQYQTYSLKDLGVTKKCYIIKCPKGNTNYRVRVTQLCKDNNKYYKSQNYVERKIYVSEATPYKLYINGIDYDIIRNFNSGWTLNTGQGQQEKENPFSSFDFQKISGWLNISNIYNEKYSWEEDEEQYGNFKVEPTLIEGSDDYDTLVQQIENRKEFVSKMKDAFYLQCEDEDKTINLTVLTDDNPHDIYTIYNAESVCENDEDYNETDSKGGDKTRKGWMCSYGSITNINSVKVPTITSYDSADFGISNDSVRQQMTASFSTDKTKCFAQDNVAKNSGSEGSISIKPPYLVACVNAEALTKPEGMTEGNFFGKTDDGEQSVKRYKFGDVGNNKMFISDGKHEFFAFHIIDKIFTVEFVSWAYMSNIPFYLPWYKYDVLSSDTNKLGYFLKTNGIFSGIVRNGNSKSGSGNYVTDFEEKLIFGKECTLKTFTSTTEDTIPTKRCILYSEDENVSNLGYQNYRHVNKGEINDNNQYCIVPNRKGELSFTDCDSNCQVSKEVYGSMKVTLKSDAVASPYNVKKTIGKYYIIKNENQSLSVSCSNSDTEKPITYYLFKASISGNITSVGNDNALWYPLNAFNAETMETEAVKYTLDCNCKEDENASNWVWDGTTSTAAHFFNKNTTKKVFKDENINVEGNYNGGLCWAGSSSQISYEDSEGNTQYITTWGYGTTGVFTKLENVPYFVVAVTEGGSRAVSPVYDFSVVYYWAGIVESNGQKFLRTALAFVLSPKNRDKDEFQCSKNVRNFYLTRFDFTVSYSFTYDLTTVSNEGISYEYSEIDFKTKDTAEIGESWVDGPDDKYQYSIYTNVGGTLLYDDNELTEEPNGTWLNEIDSEGKQKTYWYKSYDAENSKDTYKCVTFDANGDYVSVLNYDNENEIPTDYVEITSESTYYVKYSKTNEEDNSTSDVYKIVSYSIYDVEKVNSNPKIPYFMRYNDKELNDQEYEAIKKLFKRNILSAMKFYVTDITGLRHRCVLLGVIQEKDPYYWDRIVIKEPID